MNSAYKVVSAAFREPVPQLPFRGGGLDYTVGNDISITIPDPTPRVAGPHGVVYGGTPYASGDTYYVPHVAPGIRASNDPNRHLLVGDDDRLLLSSNRFIRLEYEDDDLLDTLTLLGNKIDPATGRPGGGDRVVLITLLRATVAELIA